MDQPVEILLIEDNPDDVELALHALKENKITNNIQILSDGAQALDYLFAKGKYADRDIADKPHVILLDLKLPLVSGLEVLKQIKTDDRLSSIPVVMMTTSQEERDVVESYKLGVNSYIVKPVDFEQFTESMRVIGMYWLLLNQSVPA